MTDISNTKLRLVDVSILLVFLGLMRHRKATLVAKEMQLTQPAISHALRRLRDLYRDPLFLRKAQGLEPTALARELEPRIRRAVRNISESLIEPQEFNPAESEISLRIAGFDYELAALVPQLIARTAGIGPRITITSLTLSSDDALDALLQGRVDLAIGFFETLPGRGPVGPYISKDIYVEEYVVAGRQGHSYFDGESDIRSYANEPHLLVTPSGVTKGLVDYALDALGLHRNVHATVPQFFPALSVLEHSDMIATLPCKIATLYAARFNLRFAPLPFPGPTFSVRAVRHQRDAESPVHRWLIEMLRTIHLEAR